MKPHAGALMILLACSAGCGSDDAPGSLGAVSDPAPNGGAGTSSAGSAGAGGGGGSPDAGSGAAAPVTISELLSDVPGEPCAPTAASPLALLDAGPLGLTFDRGGSSGERRFAFDSGSLAFVTFAPDGSQTAPSASGDVVAVTGGASGLSALVLAPEGGLVMSFLDAFGAALAPSIELDGLGTDSHALFTGPEGSLAVWRLDTELKGRVIAPDGVTSHSIAFGAESCGEDGCKPVVLSGEQGFTLLWSRVLHNGLSVLTWAALRPDGSTINVKTLLASSEFYRLVDATRLGDRGVALMLSEGFPDRASILMFVDPFGDVRLPVHRLLGAVEPWAIASHEDGVALVARSSEEQAVLRAFSDSGEPSSPWSCVDDSEKNSAFAPQATLFAEGDAYGILARRTDGSTAYLRVDALGNAVP